MPAGNPFPGATPPDDTIWSYGLRNPFRFSFDSLSGDLVIGDVGQRDRARRSTWRRARRPA